MTLYGTPDERIQRLTELADDLHGVVATNIALSKRVKELVMALSVEANYCYHWMNESRNKGDEERALRHQERGDRLASYLKTK